MDKRGINRILALLLVVLMAFTQMPFAAFAEGDETSDSAVPEQSSSALADENDTNATNDLDGGQELPDNEIDNTDLPEETGEKGAKNVLTLTYSGSSSGTLWYDENSDGTRNAGETGIANYPVSL